MVKARYVSVDENLAADDRLSAEDSWPHTPELTHAVFMNAPFGVIVNDRSGAICCINPAAEHILGYPEGSILRKHVSKLLSTPEWARNVRSILRRIRTDAPPGSGPHQEIIALRGDGRPIDLQLTVSEFRSNDGSRHFISFIQDIRAFKRAEHQARERLAELAHINRLGAINEIAAGLAHEIYQPLSAIRLATEACHTILKSTPGDNPEVRSSLDLIGLQVRRASDVIEQMRRFIRREIPEETRLCNANTLVRDVLTLLGHELERQKVIVDIDLHQPLCNCLINPVRIEQVFFNLIGNALDAMSGQTAGQRRLSITSRPTEDGKNCEILVRDNGPGIREEDFRRLFHPFFTTRENGLGQGLAICRSILQEYGSDLLVRNHPEGGAEFSFTLPVAPERVA